MCYRFDCKERETCDYIKKAMCIKRRTKKEYEYLMSLGIHCSLCGNRTVKAKVKNNEYQLCTKCEILIKENKAKAVV